jgi:hypothetical protein
LTGNRPKFQQVEIQSNHKVIHIRIKTPLPTTAVSQTHSPLMLPFEYYADFIIVVASLNSSELVFSSVKRVFKVQILK